MLVRSKILIADDDNMLCEMYRERFELAGFSTSICHNGEQVLAKVHEFLPDIILLDIRMPRLNGFDTLISLKSDPQTKDIPVVILTVLSRDMDRGKAISYGAADYIIKSETIPAAVIDKVQEILTVARENKITLAPK